jgi:hypothetical protein
MVNNMNVQIGDKVIFKKYAEQPEEGMDYLVPGEFYEVAEVDVEQKSVLVRFDNPDFNPKKKESEANAKTILLDIFEEEFEVPKTKGRAAKPTSKVEAPAPRGRAKAAAEPEPEADDPEAEPEEEAQPEPKAKAAPKGKAAPAKAAAKGKPAAKGKGKGKPAAKEKPAAKVDEYDDLSEDDEDSEILALVNDAADILDLAKEVSEEAAATDYKLGGVLFHVRKSGAYKELDKRYAEKGGFNLYVLEQLNTEYRKAMYLIDIYYKASKYGLDAERISAIGWAKAAKIAAVMDADNAEELLELAEDNTVSDLVDNIKTSYKEVGGTKGEKKTLKIFKFKLFEDKAGAIEEILNAVASAMEFKTLDEAFEHIVLEWATEHPVNTGSKAKASAKAAPQKPTTRARG